MSSGASGELPNGKNASSKREQNGHVAATASRSNSQASSFDKSPPSSYVSGGKALESSAQDGNSTSYHTGNSSSPSDHSTSESESDEEMSPENALEALQRDTRTAQLLQWCRVFAEPLRLRPIGIEELVGCRHVLDTPVSNLFIGHMISSAASVTALGRKQCAIRGLICN